MLSDTLHEEYSGEGITDQRNAVLGKVLIIPEKEYKGWDERCAGWSRGWAGGGRPGFPVPAVDVRAALDTEHPTKAHFVMYVYVDPSTGEIAERGYRMNKGGLADLRSAGIDLQVWVLFVDVDNPGHTRWTEEGRAAFERMWADRTGALATCGAYLTGGGYRLVQPLVHPISVEDCERAMRAWHHELRGLGIDPDPSCTDWTRLFKVPNYAENVVPTNGVFTRAVRAPWSDYSTMVPVSPPVCGVPLIRQALEIVGVPQEMPTEFLREVPDDWRAVVDALAAGFAALESGHLAYRALLGALLERGLAVEALPAAAERISAARRTDGKGRQDLALRTVRRWCAAQKIEAGWRLRDVAPGLHGTLAAMTPGVEVQVAGRSKAKARVEAQLRIDARTFVTLAKACAEMEQLAQNPPAGNTLVQVTAGAGKTTAIVMEARRSAADSILPAATRFHLAQPTNNLLAQTAALIPTSSLRRVSPVSHMQPDGSLTCRYAEQGKALARGGQSVRVVLCDGCQFATDCDAKEGWAGNRKNPTLVLAPHALVDELARLAGNGVLVLDEPPSPVVTRMWTWADADVVLNGFAGGAATEDVFTVDTVAGAYSALECLMVGARLRTDETHAAMDEVIRAGAVDLGRDPDVVLLRLRAIGADMRVKGPRVDDVAHRARADGVFAARVGDVAAVLMDLYRGVTADPPAEVWRTETGWGVASMDEGLVTALRRGAPNLLLDADGDVRVNAWSRAAGAPVDVIRIDVEDGAPIERVVIATSKATRSSWLPYRIPAWGNGLLDGYVRALAILRASGAKKVGVVTFGVIAAALGDDTVSWPGSDRELATQRAITRKIHEKAAPGIEVVARHYGGVRGMNDLQDCDGLITLGDPRPNVDDVAHAARYQGLSPDGLADAMGRAEAGQAQQRLRTVRRTRSAVGIHVGALLPSGWEGRAEGAVRVEELQSGGRPKGSLSKGSVAPDLTALTEMVEMIGLPQQELAARLGCSKGTFNRYLSGARSVPEKMMLALAALADQAQVARRYPEADRQPVSSNPPVPPSVLIRVPGNQTGVAA